MSQTQLILSSEQKFQRRVEVIRIASTLGPQQSLILLIQLKKPWDFAMSALNSNML